jgi:hypothetical protein
MNKSASLLLLAGVLGASAARAFVYETVYELQSDGDFDGDGRRDLIILDRATGNYRIAYQTAPGLYSWVAARASGVPSATGLGLGKLNSLTFDSLAVTGPDANRVNIIDANSSSVAGLPSPVYLPSLGPNAVAVIDIGGGGTTHDDLYVASIDNSGSPYRETLLRNIATTNRTVIADNALLYLRERANPVLLHTNRPPRLALFERNTGVNIDLLNIFDLFGGAAALVTSAVALRTPSPYEYVTGQFVRTNAYTEFLLYPPTGNSFFEYQITEPLPGTYALVPTNTFSLTNFIDRIIVLAGTNDTKLLIFYTNGVSAAVFNFDGLQAPTVAQQFNADAGEHFTGAGVLGNSGFMAYSAPLGQNTSSKFKQWNWTGSGYSNAASGNLPMVNAYTAAANVMQFRFEPFVTNNPLLLRLNNAGDWSSMPAFSGLPGNISVKVETFVSATQGLVNPTLTALGPAHPLAAFSLANQYSNTISLFSFSPPAGDKVSEVTISPQPGLYSAAVQLAFVAANPTDIISFRLGSGAWQVWSSALVVRLFTNTIVQYYGQPLGNSAKSAIKAAAYAFTQGPATLDSDGDGVPDYVELARGLNPNGGRDSDGDGYSDLEELIHGTLANDKTSVPSNYPHLDDQAAFDLVVTPRPWDGFSNRVTLSATGTVVRAYDFQGSLLSVTSTTNPPLPFARLTNIAIVAEDRLVAHATELHYDILTTNSDTKVGREMLGLVVVPPLVLPSVPYVYGGGNLATEANNWVNSASNAFKNLPRAVVTNSLTVNDSLESLLFEMKVAQLLGARGSNWWTNITLFPFRVSDAGRTNPPQATLLSLEMKTSNQPGYKLQAAFATISNLVENSASVGIADLRQVVQDIYRINSVLNNTNPATFVSPVDEIRYFLWNGTMNSNYLFWATTTGQFSSALTGAGTILASVSPRPTTNVMLLVRLDTLGGPCRILDLNGGGPTFALLDAAGRPFGFPDNFQLLPGALVEISGYTDVATLNCAFPAIEVTSALLCSVPIATDADGDGNLLIDTWEKKFFGALGLVNPFGDDDGDGYSNLQEMLEGSDPDDFYGRPAVPPAAFDAPVVMFDEAGGHIELHFQWPASYIGKFNFGVRHTAEIGTPFLDLPATGPSQVAGDEFEMTFTVPATTQHFYYLTVSLH